MTPSRTRTLVASAGTTALLLVALGAGPASAHGALDSPLSRAAACGPEGGRQTSSRACDEARAARGGQGFDDDWDEIRVPGVDGRDREVIPDGELCSGGIDRFAGLDGPGTGWPATTLRPGAEFTFSYRATIPHTGDFRLFVTRDGYDPAQALTWSDLEAEPFLTVTDPPLDGDAYRIEGTLPSDRDGRHLIYTVWRNTDTPDTYYSCSDVIFEAAGEGDEGGAIADDPILRDPPGGQAAAEDPAALPPGDDAAAVATRGPAVPLTAALAVVLIGGGILLLRRRRS